MPQPHDPGRVDQSFWIDVIRGLCAVAVVLGHWRQLLFSQSGADSYGILTIVFKAIWRLSAYSHKAVIVFFVLSGYLVGGIYLKKFIRRTDSRTEYICSRIARIYTVLIPGILFTYLSIEISTAFFDGNSVIKRIPDFFPSQINVEQSVTVTTAACNLAALQTIICHQYGLNLSLWSLSNELLYYALFFCILNAFRNYVYWLVAGAVFAVMLLPAVAFADTDRTMIYFGGFGIWIMGVIAFFLVSIREDASIINLFAVLLFFITIMIENIGITLIVSDLAFGAQIACCLILIKRIKYYPPRLARYPFSVMADISYSLYVMHVPTLIFIMAVFDISNLDKTWISLLLGAAVFIATITIACFFYLCTERYTPTIRKLFMSKLNEFSAKYNQAVSIDRSIT